MQAVKFWRHGSLKGEEEKKQFSSDDLPAVLPKKAMKTPD
jgi:hypothetical protein